MTEQNLHFNRKLLYQRKKRNLFSIKNKPNNFLKKHIIDNIFDRLLDIKRDFPLALIYGDDTLFASLYKKTPDISRKITDLIQADLVFQNIKNTSFPTVSFDEEAFPFPDKTFDLIISVLSLHWVNDLPGTLIQARRALKPDGLFIAALFGHGTLTDLTFSLLQAELKYRHAAATRIAPFIDIQQGAHLLQRAGFALPVSDISPIIVNYKTPETLIQDIRDMGETSILTPRAPPLTMKIFKEALSFYKQKTLTDHHRYKTQFNILYLTGWAPHSSQPKPLKPGSANTRLADALNTKEHKF